jgi:pyrroloquinoline quinone biosynthesis protein B
MLLHLLGTAAGGGFPQWNCNCENCRGVRTGTVRATPRLQAGLALSADGHRWFLVGASPDIRLQIESFPPLKPRGPVRGSPLEGVLLASADLDHILGLLMLREGGQLAIHATRAVQSALTEGLTVRPVLERYGDRVWVEPAVDPEPLRLRDGTPSGLLYQAFPVPGKPPRYRDGHAAPDPGDCVGYRIEDQKTGGKLVVLHGTARLDRTVFRHLEGCDAALFDGTFWSEHEMSQTGAGNGTASEMGHLPIGGSDGSLARLGALPIAHKIYWHINNTNPILRDDSPERRAVDEAGLKVGWDGLELTL